MGLLFRSDETGITLSCGKGAFHAMGIKGAVLRQISMETLKKVALNGANFIPVSGKITKLKR